MRIIRKIPRGLGRYEPLRHADHPRPTTRRQFLAQGFMTGGASVLLPSIFSLMANPRIAQAQPALVADIQNAVTRVRHHGRRRNDPLHLLRPVGRRAISPARTFSAADRAVSSIS